MPELPEVETIVRSLRMGNNGKAQLIGSKIIRAKVYWHKTLDRPSIRTFKKRIVGQTIQDITRRGKYIVIQLSSDVMLIHLRMSGDILVARGEKPLGTHTRLSMWLDNELQIAFNDTRKFGRVWLVKDSQEVLEKLGPEPLEIELTSEKLYQMLQSKKRQIKPLLLDQHFIAGIGNIYADEALHLAKIHPQQASNKINMKQTVGLLASIRKVLEEGIERNGASIDWVYKGGEYQNYFRVYQRTGESCFVCSRSIERIVVGQRSTHFCPNCQQPPV